MKLMLLEEWKKSIHEASGIDPKKESDMRHEAVYFIEALLFLLELKQKKLAKSIVLFHRFSAQVSFKDFDRFLLGAACVFLTAKLEDDPRPLDKCVKCYYYCLLEKKNIIVDNKDKLAYLNNMRKPERLEEFFKSIDPNILKENKTKFLDAEEFILKMIGFDFSFDTPYSSIEAIFRKFYPESTTNSYKNLQSTAEKFANDSLKTTLSLYYDPIILGMACLYSAMNFEDLLLPDYQEKKWFQLLNPNVTFDDIEKASQDLQKYYDSK